MSALFGKKKPDWEEVIEDTVRKLIGEVEKGNERFSELCQKVATLADLIDARLSLLESDGGKQSDKWGDLEF